MCTQCQHSTAGRKGYSVGPSLKLRPGIGRSIKKPSNQMRVVDDFLKSVAFVAELISSDVSVDDIDHIATGFFVTIPIPELPGRQFHHFVTAKHVVTGLKQPSCLVINKRGGGVTVLREGIVENIWWTHPTDPHADVAIAVINMESSFDITAIPIDIFATADLMSKRGIGIGDEVFTVGLFSYVPGQSRNTPIVRYGTIAMMPDDDIYVGSGFTKAYLTEARSIGGVSGSPVFVRETRALPLNDGGYMQGVGNHYLLGLMHGHWDLAETEMNKQGGPSSIRGVNMGISIVVPASKILETLYNPALVARRKLAVEYHLASMRPTMD